MIELNYSAKSFFLTGKLDIICYRMGEFELITKHVTQSFYEYPNLFLFSEKFLTENFTVIGNFYNQFLDELGGFLKHESCQPFLQFSDEEFDLALNFMETCFGSITVLVADQNIHI